jgi:hypothetical protein
MQEVSQRAGGFVGFVANVPSPPRSRANQADCAQEACHVGFGRLVACLARIGLCAIGPTYIYEKLASSPYRSWANSYIQHSVRCQDSQTEVVLSGLGARPDSEGSSAPGERRDSPASAHLAGDWARRASMAASCAPQVRPTTTPREWGLRMRTAPLAFDTFDAGASNGKPLSKRIRSTASCPATLPSTSIISPTLTLTPGKFRMRFWAKESASRL